LASEEKELRATNLWLSECGAEFSAGSGKSSYAPLTNYTPEYRQWGHGETIVLIPGLAGGIDLLGPLARQLAKRFRVLSYQLRGEDDCFALRRRFDLTDLASDLSDFLDWHCLENPIIIGVSFGGLIAMQFATQFPNRVDRLVVQGVGARFERDLLKRVAGLVLSRIPLPADNPFINQFFNLLFGGPQEQQAPLFRFVTQRCWQTDQSMMAHRFSLAERFAMGERFRRIRAKTLIVSGERDVLVSRRSLDELTSEIHDAELVCMPQCGHLAAVTHAKRLAEEICQFVA
jgi:pimeloyl-ACP methyl ester carboxylesterase